METIAVFGPFNGAMQAALKSAIPQLNFHLVFSPEIDQELLRQADYVILRTLRLDAPEIALLDKCRLIQRWGAGFDTVDIAAAGKRGIPVAVTAGMNATPVSEMALALMLAVYRNVVPMTLDAMDGTWSRETYAKRSYTVSGKAVGIYGIGNIGRKVAALTRAFGAEVIYYDPFRLPEDREKELGVTYVDPDTLLRDSDILSLHAPLTEQTRNFICADTLARMKDGAVLINTAREELVDYAAAAQALKSGKLLGAGFDAIEEDLVRENPFMGLRNVVLTQHLGGNTTDNAVQMAQRIAQQITAVRDGKKLEKPHLVNGEFLQE